MTNPDDRELEKYLKGDSKLSRLYKEASTERAPSELDDAILAAAKREVRAKPGLSKVLAPVALAASLILGVNLAWNIHEAQSVPQPTKVRTLEKAGNADLDAMYERMVEVNQPAATSHEKKDDGLADVRKANAEPAGRAERDRQEDVAAAQMQQQAQANESAKKENEAMSARRAPAMADSASAMGAMSAAPSESAPVAAAPAPAAPAPAAPAMKVSEPMASGGAASHPAPVLSESAKIDRLLAYVGSLSGAVFIRNGDEHTPTEAVAHMKLKREKAGDRVKTADDFIRLCASHSYLSGKAYLIRFADGRTRTAEDVLREELARLERGRSQPTNGSQ